MGSTEGWMEAMTQCRGLEEFRKLGSSEMEAKPDCEYLNMLITATR